MADGRISQVQLPSGNTYSIRAGAIPYGKVDSTSTSTAFTATVPGITELVDGTCMMLKNEVVTSAANFTININGLGAKPVYSNMASGYPDKAPTRESTLFNIAYVVLFIYTESLPQVSGGAWIFYRGYYSDANSIGYQLRTNSTVMTVSDTARYYKIYFTSADNTKWVPASVNSKNDATTARAVNQRAINPFGRIVYTSASTNYTSGSNLAATTLWDQYNLTLGYSFNVGGGTLALTTKAPVYLKCAPQSNGSAIMDSTTPIVQALPSTEDGKIYIYLGVATSATQIELFMIHPIYYYKDGAIRLWINSKETTLPSNIVNTITTTAGAHTAVTNATGDVSFSIPTTAAHVNAAASDHSHGNINNAGQLTNAGVAIANRDALVVAQYPLTGDYPIAKTSLIFDGTTTTKVLAKKGDWVDLPSGISPYTSNPEMDGTASAGSSTLYAKGDHVHPTDTSRAPLASPALTGTPTAPTASVSTDTTQIATTAFVHDVVDGLPTPMQFIGTVGTDSTATVTWTNLPTASGHAGYTYKVIADHAAETGKPAAKVGDTIISNGTDWIVIPSGDEPSGTVTSVGITNGGGLSVSGSPVTSSGSITLSHADTSSQASSSNSGRTYIQSVTLDTYGHVTGLSTATETVTDTNTTYSLSNALSSHKFTETLTAGGSGSGTSTATMEFAAGGVINLTDDTTNKKITIGISNANPNYVLAGPSTGSAAAPTFRQLSASEIIGYTNAQTQQNVSVYSWIQELDQDIDAKVDDVKVNNTSVVGNDRVAYISMDAQNVWAQFQNTNYLDSTGDVSEALTALDTALGSHTHTTSIATSTGTNQLTLEHGGKYALTAGGTSYIFTMPAAPTTSDTKVTNTLDTTTKYYMTGTTSNTTNTGTQIFDTGIYSTTTAGQLNATTYKVNEQVTMQWNSTTSSLDYIFA